MNNPTFKDAALHEGETHIMIAGAGLLALSVCKALAASAGAPLRIVVIARSEPLLTELCLAANQRSRALRGGLIFEPALVDFESQDCLESIVSRFRPRIILSCVSYHSPWESLRRSSAWTRLVTAAGFGVTLPLQFPLTARIMRAAARCTPAAVLINGCFPDAVNAALRVASIPVLCGIGNVSALAADLEERVNGIGKGRLQLLAHHRHLSSPVEPWDEAKAWIDGEPVEDVSDRLRATRALDRRELCGVGGVAGAILMRRLLESADSITHVPGPNGLPGGYPVRFRSGCIELNLPPGISEQQAIEWNQYHAEHDGVTVGADGVVQFSNRAKGALKKWSPEWEAGFHVHELEVVCKSMLSMRDRLRSVVG